MQKAKAFEGQWVWFVDERTKTTYNGYIVGLGETKADVKIIKKKVIAEVPYVLLHDNEGVRWNIEDINEQLHLAVNSNDREWFDELHEMKRFIEEAAK